MLYFIIPNWNNPTREMRDNGDASRTSLRSRFDYLGSANECFDFENLYFLVCLTPCL